MSNRIDDLFKSHKRSVLAVYFTAGYPSLADTAGIVSELEDSGVDLIEIGVPFSDPVADGFVIQKSSDAALKNGMTLSRLFEQLKGVRSKVSVPLVIMSYFNPVLKYGVEEFCEKCCEVGVDGVILPDLPPEVYQDEYRYMFERYGLYNIMMITPQTSECRIREIDKMSSGFVYMVSSTSTTGGKGDIESCQEEYFERVEAMKLSTPRLVGFGIFDHTTFSNACKKASGAIIGSAFINVLSEEGVSLPKVIREFVVKVRGCKNGE